MDQQYRGTHLFTVKVWAEEVSEDHQEWRGKVQHVLSGEAHYFRDWPNLVSCLMTMLLDEKTGGHHELPTEEITNPHEAQV